MPYFQSDGSELVFIGEEEGFGLFGRDGVFNAIKQSNQDWKLVILLFHL